MGTSDTGHVRYVDDVGAPRQDDQTCGEASAPHGRPRRGVPALQDPAEGLRITRVSTAPSLWVVGAHGGAGASTLARIDEAARWVGPTWQALSHAWPHPIDQAQRCPCVLVARTHASGLLAAQKALRQWASGVLPPQVDLLGLVLVADAPGRLPKPLRDLADLVAGGAPAGRAWRLGWVEAWRMGEVPPRAELPHSVRTLIDDLMSLSAAGAVSRNPEGNQL